MQGIETIVRLPMGVAETALRNALAEQGFGVLTEIDVAATLRARLGIERRPLKILGACNPLLAHRALELDPSVALLLPCNVVIEPTDDGTHIAIADPRELMSDPVFSDLAEDAASRLRKALDAIAVPAV